MGFRQHLGLVPKQLLIVVADHRRTGARGNHDVLRIPKHLEKVARDLSRFVAVAAVEGGLAAARLVRRKGQATTRPLQHVGHSHSDVWKQLVHDAGDKQSNLNWHGRHILSCELQPDGIPCICKGVWTCFVDVSS